jgi:alpha-L-rhamnosidase
MTSFNHYALGAVADWLHRTVAGLAPDAPGYARLRIAPRPLPSLSHASARHLTPYGEASVAWHREGFEIVVRAVVPPNTTAVVELPSAPVEIEVVSGVHEWRFPAPAATERPPLDGIAASLADVIDDPRAYRALLDTVANFDAGRAEAVRAETVWGANRGVGTALMFVPPTLIAEVDAALRAATGAPTP